MTSTFKLIKAEFKKLFKYPSIYIVALLIVATILGCRYMFDPDKLGNKNITYTGKTTSQEYYDTFSNTTIKDSQDDMNKTYDTTNNLITYYQIYLDKITNLKDSYSALTTQIELFISENDTKLLNGKKDKVTNALKEFKVAYEDYTGIELYDHIILVRDYMPECSTTIEFLESCEDPNKTPTNIKDEYNANSYAEKLHDEYVGGINFIETTFNSIKDMVIEDYNTFLNSVNTGSAQNLSNIRTCATNLSNSIAVYIDYNNKIFNTNLDTILAITDKKSFDDIMSICIEAIQNIDSGKEFNDFKTTITNFLISNNFSDKIKNFSSNVKQVDITKELVDDFLGISKTVHTNQVKIDNMIFNCRENGGIKEISACITDYYYLAHTYHDYVINSMIAHIIDGYDSSEYMEFYSSNPYFENYNKYNSNEKLVLARYYITTNTYENSYINNFSFNQTSYGDGSVYDFMYFAMEFVTIIITVFAMMLMCSIITAETESGTIKLLLVRPFKRSKILTAKLLATLFFALIFMIFSSILTFVVGYYSFGMLTQASMLSVINGSVVIEISPVFAMIINIISLLFDVVFYVILALMISVIFKNYIGSVTLTITFMIATFVLNAFCGNMLWYSFLPAMNLHLYKYFGNAFISQSTDNILYKLLMTPIQNSMTLPFSILIILSYMLLFIGVAYSVFKKRDF